MIKRADWKAAYRELIEEGLQKLGEPPSADQLLAHSRGKLAAEEAARVQEHLSFDPALARALVEPFPPDESRPGDPDHLTDEELRQDWQAIQTRLAEKPAAVAESKRIPHAWQAAEANLMELLHRALVLWRWLTAAATGVAAVLALFAFQARMDVQRLTRELAKPRINAEHRVLLPDGTRDAAGARGGVGEGSGAGAGGWPGAGAGGGSGAGAGTVAEEPPILLRAETDHYLLAPIVAYQPPYPDYRLRIVEVDADREKEIWTATGLRPNGETFEIWVPQAFLRSGDLHRLEIYGLRDGKADLLGTYTVQLQDS